MKISSFRLERFFAKYEFDVPYLLCSSDCESVSVNELLKLEPEAEKALKNLWLGYTESAGAPQLRQEIAKLYQTVETNQVLVHAGAEEAIFVFMNIALDAGEHAIVHDPCYQSLYSVAASIGCEVTKWTGQEQDGWELELDVLRQQIKVNTKAIIMNCPHNPTGYLMSLEKLQEIVDIARKHGLLLFSDEVYRGLEYDKDDRLPAACDLYEHAVSLGVMSKTHGLAGLRIGWIATKDRQVYNKMAVFKDYTTICNSAPSEFLATLALRHKKQLVQRNREIIVNNLHELNRFSLEFGHLFHWVAPKAGPITFPCITFERNVEDLCVDLAEKKGVLLLPGNYYDFGNRHFRIGFGRKNFPEALGRFEEYLRENYKDWM